MKEVHIQDLLAQGYSEDAEGLKVFQRQHFRPALLLVLVVVALALTAGLVLGWSAKLEPIALVALGLLWVVVFTVLIKGSLANPRSRHTGKRLLKFKNASPGRSSFAEIVYICPESRTYFIQVYPSGPI